MDKRIKIDLRKNLNKALKYPFKKIKIKVKMIGSCALIETFIFSLESIKKIERPSYIYNSMLKNFKQMKKDYPSKEDKTLTIIVMVSAN